MKSSVWDKEKGNYTENFIVSDGEEYFLAYLHGHIVTGEDLLFAIPRTVVFVLW